MQGEGDLNTDLPVKIKFLIKYIAILYPFIQMKIKQIIIVKFLNRKLFLT